MGKDAKFCSNPKNAKNKKCVAYNKQMAYQKKAKFCMQEENKEKEFCQKMPERDDEQTKNKKDFMTTMKEYCMENKESMKCKAFAMKMEKCCEEEGECGVSCDDGEAYDKEKKMCMPVACNAAEACGEDQKSVPFKAECEEGKFCKQFKCLEPCTDDETFDVVNGKCAPMNCNALMTRRRNVRRTLSSALSSTAHTNSPSSPRDAERPNLIVRRYGLFIQQKERSMRRTQERQKDQM